MTIPSIGGNGKSGSGINSNIKKFSEPQEYFPEGANDNSMENKTPETPVKEPEKEQAAAQNRQAKPTEKEYSLRQFQYDYKEILSEKVIPQIVQFEKGRELRLTLLTMLSTAVFAIAAAFIYYMFKTEMFKNQENADMMYIVFTLGLIGMAVSFVTWVWHCVKKSFEKKIKRKFMPVLMRAIPGFFWQETPPVKSKEIVNCMIFPDTSAIEQSDVLIRNPLVSVEQSINDMLPGNIRYEFDDCFVGSYRQVPVAISECKYILNIVHQRYDGKTHTYEVKIFEGAIVKIKMNKRFHGITVIRPKNIARDIKDGKDLDKAALNKVFLEDVEFEKKYCTYSSDQIEARYLITTAFMERFKNLQTAFKTRKIFCSFFDDSVYIAPCADRDLFALGSLIKPLYDRKQFDELYNQFSAILALVDYFKLDKKLGL